MIQQVVICTYVTKLSSNFLSVHFLSQQLQDILCIVLVWWLSPPKTNLKCISTNLFVLKYHAKSCSKICSLYPWQHKSTMQCKNNNNSIKENPKNVFLDNPHFCPLSTIKGRWGLFMFYFCLLRWMNQ